MWLIPVIALGVALFAASGSKRDVMPVYMPAPLPAPTPTPGPIVVLGDYLLNGAWPPPPVVWCAIAEAESLGRHDIADGIVRLFILPVVEREQARARAAQAEAERVVHEQTAIAAVTTAIAIANSEAPPVLDLPPTSIAEPAPEPPPIQQIQRQLASPIDTVDPVDWDKFCSKLVREEPTYVSAKHVGQYRQRKERLAELGIEAHRIVNSREEQRKALDADLSDAYRHVDASGLAERYIRRPLTIPGHPDAYMVTMSGVLGVIQAAGLDGAADWLEKPSDRKRFPHTTAAFIRTNGVF